jgi:hypothetical protein
MRWHTKEEDKVYLLTVCIIFGVVSEDGEVLLTSLLASSFPTNIFNRPDVIEKLFLVR